MISRVADHCFWLGRYLERAEGSARLLQATRQLVLDADIPLTQCWQPLVIVAGQMPAFHEHHGVEAFSDTELVQHYMTWSDQNPVSLLSSVGAARECARAIREVLSLDVWEELNELFHSLQTDAMRRSYEENPDEVYAGVRRGTQLTLGLVRSTMLHDEPMSFLWLGAMVERVGQTARILDMHHHTLEREAVHDVVQVALWLTLLKACSGTEAFMRKSQGRVTARSVVSFLIFEPTFPRSLRYCLRTCEGLLERLWPQGESDDPEARPLTRVQALLSWLDRQGGRLEGGVVHELLTHVVDETSLVCAEVSKRIEGPRHATQTQSQESRAQ